jgi:hypothetical protein
MHVARFVRAAAPNGRDIPGLIWMAFMTLWLIAPDGWAQQTYFPEKDLSHFLCYTFTTGGAVPGTPSFTDQWNTKEIVATTISYLCNPTDKTPDVVGKQPFTFKRENPDEHLVCYLTTTLPNKKRVQILNQFTSDPKHPRVLDVENSTLACVPSTKSKGSGNTSPPDPPPLEQLKNLSHFLCYNIKHDSVNFKQITVQDQFMQKPMKISINLSPSLLCNPADKKRPDKAEQPRLHPEAHLVCYDVKMPPDLSLPQVRIRNQFEETKPTAPGALYRLCVPSLKYTVDP